MLRGSVSFHTKSWQMGKGAEADPEPSNHIQTCQAPCSQLDEPGLGLALVDLMLAGVRLALGPGAVSLPSKQSQQVCAAIN